MTENSEKLIISSDERLNRLIESKPFIEVIFRSAKDEITALRNTVFVLNEENDKLIEYCAKLHDMSHKTVSDMRQDNPDLMI